VVREVSLAVHDHRLCVPVLAARRWRPEARIWDPPEFSHLAFPEQLSPNVAAPGWRPEFYDYVYLGFTNATALSPTDVMPLARWSKLAMTVQAIASLMILGLVIARAVNILK
jgi:hypothetical protein